MKLIVGFSSPKSWKVGAEAIKLWIQKPYSHVFVAWKSDKISRVLVYHAAHGSVHFLSMERMLQENNLIKAYEVEIQDEQHVKLMQRCIDLAGEDYGYKELAKIVIKDACDLLGFQCKIIDNSRGYICSELLAELLLELGAKFDRPPFLVRPDHIEEALKQMNSVEV
jgi:hypothetical protein